MLKKKTFAERSIAGTLAFLREAVFSDECASRQGFLQSLDPRIKTATFILFLLLIIAAKSLLVLLCFYAAAILLAYSSGISPLFFLKRTWIFIPLFTLFIAIPAVFGVFTPGEPLAVLKIAGLQLVITRQGLFGAALFVARVTTSVSLAVLLSITTKHFDLLKVLRVFRIPRLFVLTLGMCYRYIFLFVGIIENARLAVKSRVGGNIRGKNGRRVAAYNIASLWQRSYQLNDDVYKAMLSRGYNGEPAVLDDFKAGPRDWLWLAGSIIIALAAVYFNYRTGT